MWIHANAKTKAVPRHFHLTVPIPIAFNGNRWHGSSVARKQIRKSNRESLLRLLGRAKSKIHCRLGSLNEDVNLPYLLWPPTAETINDISNTSRKDSVTRSSADTHWTDFFDHKFRDFQVVKIDIVFRHTKRPKEFLDLTRPSLTVLSTQTISSTAPKLINMTNYIGLPSDITSHSSQQARFIGSGASTLECQQSHLTARQEPRLVQNESIYCSQEDA